MPVYKTDLDAQSDVKTGVLLASKGQHQCLTELRPVRTRSAAEINVAHQILQ